jgi:hypothetical protein
MVGPPSLLSQLTAHLVAGHALGSCWRNGQKLVIISFRASPAKTFLPLPVGECTACLRCARTEACECARNFDQH